MSCLGGGTSIFLVRLREKGRKVVDVPMPDELVEILRTARKRKRHEKSPRLAGASLKRRIRDSNPCRRRSGFLSLFAASSVS